MSTKQLLLERLSILQVTLNYKLTPPIIKKKKTLFKLLFYIC